MGRGIMVRQAKGHLIGQTANARRLVRRQIARRMLSNISMIPLDKT